MHPSYERNVKIVDQAGKPVEGETWWGSVAVDRQRLIAHFRPEHAGHGVGTLLTDEPAYTVDCRCGERVHVGLSEVDVAMQAAADQGDDARRAFEAVIGPLPAGADRPRHRFKRGSVPEAVTLWCENCGLTDRIPHATVGADLTWDELRAVYEKLESEPCQPMPVVSIQASGPHALVMVDGPLLTRPDQPEAAAAPWPASMVLECTRCKQRRPYWAQRPGSFRTHLILACKEFDFFVAGPNGMPQCKPVKP